MPVADPYRLDRSVGRLYRRGEEPEDGPIADGLAHIWWVTLACWALGNPDLAKKDGEPRMRFDITRLKRRAPKKA